MRAGSHVLRERGEKEGVYPYVMLLVDTRHHAESLGVKAEEFSYGTGVRVVVAADNQASCGWGIIITVAGHSKLSRFVQ